MARIAVLLFLLITALAYIWWREWNIRRKKDGVTDNKSIALSFLKWAFGSRLRASLTAWWVMFSVVAAAILIHNKESAWDAIFADGWLTALVAAAFLAIVLLAGSAIAETIRKGEFQLSSVWERRIKNYMPFVVGLMLIALIFGNMPNGRNTANTTADSTRNPRVNTAQEEQSMQSYATTVQSEPTADYAERIEPELPHVSFIAPRGGETLVHNHIFEFRWNALQLPKETLLDLFLVRVGQTQDVYQGLGSVHNSGSYLWKVWDVMEPGQYRLRITRGFDNVLAESEIFIIAQ